MATQKVKKRNGFARFWGAQNEKFIEILRKPSKTVELFDFLLFGKVKKSEREREREREREKEIEREREREIDRER